MRIIATAIVGLFFIQAAVAEEGLSFATSGGPEYYVLENNSVHNVSANSEVLLIVQMPDIAWFRLFVNGEKICDIREPRQFYICPYTTPAAAGSHQVEVRTNSNPVVTSDSPNMSFYSSLVIDGDSDSMILSSGSSHTVEPGSAVRFLAQVPETAWFRLFVSGVKICDIRQPRPFYFCDFTAPENPGPYEIEVRTNSSLVVTSENPNRVFYSTLLVNGVVGAINLSPGSTHSASTDDTITFNAEVADTAWFRLFVDGTKICDIRTAQSSYTCDYDTPSISGQYSVEVRTNAALVADDNNPNRSFFSELSVVAPGYVLHFFDDFDDIHAGRPDPEHWDYHTGPVINNERQCYTDDHQSYVNAGVSNVRVETRDFEGEDNGYLVLELKRENVACRQANGQTFNYTSGAVSTRVDEPGGEYLVNMPHGIYEVRAKIPAGRGTWPAIWLLGKKDYTPQDPFTIGWPDAGEIDIMEAVGFEEDNGFYRTHHTLHRNKDEGFLWAHQRPNETGQGMTLPMNEPPSANFHVYKMIWKPESIEIFVDNVRVKKMDFGNGNTRQRDGFFRNDPDLNGFGFPGTTADDYLGWPWAMEADNEFKLIFNVAFGGGWGGQQGLDNSIFTNGQRVEMLVDYVRIYAGQ